MITTDRIPLSEIARLYDEAYNEPPTAAAKRAYREAGDYYRAEASRLLAQGNGITLTVTNDPEPYVTAKHQAADVLYNHRFIVTSAYSDHDMWDTMTNVSYRIVHDLVGHATQPNGFTPEFTTGGELVAWSQQLAYLQRTSQASQAVRDVSFAETVGQLAYAHTYHKFPDQQRGVLLKTATTADISY